MPVNKEVLSKYISDVFIETGTYKGQTVEIALNLGFKEIYSLELNSKLYKKARRKFKKNKNVFLFEGDSITMLPEVLEKISAPATFWLDAHESGPGLPGGKVLYPILEELKIVAGHFVKTHTIMVDDRRIFVSSILNGVPLSAVKSAHFIFSPSPL